MKILLYSGGMDSWLIKQLWKPDECVYVNMHTRYSNEEMQRLPSSVKVIDFPLGQWEMDNAIIPLRNLYLVMAICNTYADNDLEICLGATAGDRVLDKSPEFAIKTSQLLSFLYQKQHWTSGRKIRIALDYKQKTKTQILQEYIANGGDIQKAFDESFSCYNPSNGNPCWNCKPCFRKFVSFAMNGMKFPDEVVKSNIAYIQREILPDIKAGTYGRKDEEAEILSVLEIYGKRDYKIYAIDFDNTLTYNANPPEVRLNIDAIEKVKKLRDRGNKIMLYTSRIGPYLDEAVELCKGAGLVFDSVVSGKPVADYYIDDKNIHIQNI